MDRVYNFAPGPAMLPLEVLEKVSRDILNYNNSGMSVMEIPCGSREFEEIVTSLENAVRRLLDVPQNYKILLIPGGAVEQYSAIPLNLFSDRKTADYIITSPRSRDACQEAKKYGHIYVAASNGGASPVYHSIPELTKVDFHPDVDYVYMCYSDSTYGIRFHYVPDTGNIPLVADMTDFLFSEPIDVSKFGLIFASAESNFGISGVTLVIVREDLINRQSKDIPTVLNYKLIADNPFSIDTPPIYSIYVMKEMLEWMISIGGLEELKRRNERKAGILYDVLTKYSGLYVIPISTHRSMLNVRFHTNKPGLDERFLAEAAERGLINLEAQDDLVGMCASIYNAMPTEGVELLRDFIREFAIKYQGAVSGAEEEAKAVRQRFSQDDDSDSKADGYEALLNSLRIEFDDE
jgi:phosphoserine aminotransferase